MKSIVYATNTSTQTVAVNGSISFGTPIRRNGYNCNVFNDGIIEGAGLYEVLTNITIAGAAAGTATVTLYKDGLAIPGAQATIPTTTSSVDTISIPCIVRNSCCKESIISAVVTGVGITVNNASIIIEKA